MASLVQTVADNESKLGKADGFQKTRENMKFKVLIADDHGVVRKGLRLLFGTVPGAHGHRRSGKRPGSGDPVFYPCAANCRHGCRNADTEWH